MVKIKIDNIEYEVIQSLANVIFHKLERLHTLEGLLKEQDEIINSFKNDSGIAQERIDELEIAIEKKSIQFAQIHEYVNKINNIFGENEELGQDEKLDQNEGLDQDEELDEDEASRYFKIAAEKYNLGDCHDSIINYTKAIRLNPNDSRAYNNRGVAKYILEDKNGAITDYTEAIQINPKDGIYYRNRGIAKSDLGDKIGAISDFTEAIRINPNDACSYQYRGNAMFAAADKEQALANLNKAAIIFHKEDDTERYQIVLKRIEEVKEAPQ